MSEVTVRIRDLSKRYRIGSARKQATSKLQAVGMGLLAPFEYLRSTLREPDEDETLWALRDVTMDVCAGEPLAIVGRNGAGKSTLLKVLSRITEPTSGRAEIAGRVGSLLEVGTGFHKELTGRENVYMNGAVLGMQRDEIDRKFDEIVAFAGVEKFIDTPVKRYSSGMHVRLGFAVAAHLEPEVLLIDEVLAVGDADFQRRCLGKMGQVAKEGRTIVFVSHNMTAVASICPRAVLLHDGRVSAIGNTAAVIDEYLSMGRSESLERTWKDMKNAPGSDCVSLCRVAVCPRRSRPDGPITYRIPLDVEVDLQSEGANDIAVRLFVKSVSGETVFAVTSPQRDLPKGGYKFTCHIPGHLLNDGVYTLLVEVLSELRSSFVAHEVVTFEVQDLDREGSWFGKWPGAVRPELPWTVSADAAASLECAADEAGTPSR